MYQSSRRQSYVIVDTVLPQAFYTPYLSSTPQVLWEVIKCSATNRLHRNLTSPGYSAGSAVWLLKYHYPLRLSSPSVGSNPTSFKVSFNRSLQRGDLRAPFELGLLAHHELTQVTCLMVSIFNCQRSVKHLGCFHKHSASPTSKPHHFLKSFLKKFTVRCFLCS